MNPVLSIFGKDTVASINAVPRLYNTEEVNTILKKNGLTATGDTLKSQVTDLTKEIAALHQAKQNETKAKVVSFLLVASQVAFVALAVVGVVITYPLGFAFSVCLFSALAIQGLHTVAQATRVFMESLLPGKMQTRPLILALLLTPIDAVRFAFTEVKRLETEVTVKTQTVGRLFEETINCYKEHYAACEQELKQVDAAYTAKRTDWATRIQNGSPFQKNEPVITVLERELGAGLRMQNDQQTLSMAYAHLYAMNEYLQSITSVKA